MVVLPAVITFSEEVMANANTPEVPEVVRNAYLSGRPSTVTVVINRRTFVLRIIPSNRPVEILWSELLRFLESEHLT
jgi:hypothetical protein